MNNDVPISLSRNTIHVGLYVDKFVFFSNSDTEEQQFSNLHSKHVHVEFMGDTDLFLCNKFELVHQYDGNLLVHLYRHAFVDPMVAQFGLKDCKWTLTMTPYCSIWLIDFIKSKDKDNPYLRHCTKELKNLT